MEISAEELHIRAIRKKFSGDRENVAQLLHNALNVITTTLNASDHHFLLELIQNAEDNSYVSGEIPYLSFKLKESPEYCKLYVENNEEGFKRANVESICNVGASTKKQFKRMGYIGEKGLGFKSVFQVAYQVAIISNGYKFALSSRDDPDIHIPYIIPTWQRKLKNLYTKTMLILWLKKEKVEIVKKGLQRMSPESILFLNKLHELHVSLPESVFRVVRNTRYSLVTLKSDKRVTYFVHKITYEVPVNVQETRRSGVLSRDVCIAFPLFQSEIKVSGRKRARTDDEFEDDENDELVTPLVNVFAYLPTSINSGLPFLINADFLLNSAREILTDPQTNRWNRWLLYDCIPACFVEAFKALLFNEEDVESERDRLKAYSFIPLLRAPDEKDARPAHQQHGTAYFTKIAEKVREELSKMEIVLVPFPSSMPKIDREGLGVFKIPSECRIGPPKMYEIFGELEDGLQLVHPSIAKYRDQLLAIGVKHITPAEILAHLTNPLLFDNKDPHWWLELYTLLMDLSWKKEDVSGIDVDLFLPLDDYNLDTLHPRRFFPPEASSIPSFAEHNANYFLPCLRKNVYNFLKHNEPKVLDWLHKSLNVHHLTISDYCIAFTKYLEEEAKAGKITRDKLIEGTQFLFANARQMDARARRYVKTHLPVLGYDNADKEKFILRSLDNQPELIYQSGGWANKKHEYSKIFPADDHVEMVNFEYKSFTNLHLLLPIKKVPLPKLKFIEGAKPMFSRHPLSWMSVEINPETHDKAAPSTGETFLRAQKVIKWLLDIKTQNEDFKPLVDNGEIEPWEYDVFAYEEGNPKPIASDFLHGLRHTHWLPTQLGLFPPTNVFLSDLNMNLKFSKTLHIPTIEIPQHVLPYLAIKVGSSTKQIYAIVEDELSNSRPMFYNLSQLYVMLEKSANSGQEKKEMCEYFQTHALIWTGRHKRMSTDPFLVWSKDAHAVFPQYTCLENYYYAVLRNFFSDILRIPYEIPLSEILGKLSELRNAKVDSAKRTREKVEQIYFVLNGRARHKETHDKLKEYFSSHPYVFVDGKWRAKELCVWDDHEFLRTSMKFLCRTYSQTLRDFFHQEINIKKVNEVFCFELLDDCARNEDFKDAAYIAGIYKYLFTSCKHAIDKIREHFWKNEIILCGGCWQNADRCIWPDLSDKFSLDFVYLSQYDIYKNETMKSFFIEYIGIPLKPRTEHLIEKWKLVQKQTSLSVEQIQATLHNLLLFLSPFSVIGPDRKRLAPLVNQGQVFSTRGKFCWPKECYWSEDEELQHLFEHNDQIDIAWKPHDMERKYYAVFCRMMNVRDLLSAAIPHVSTTPSLYHYESRFFKKYLKEGIVHQMCNQSRNMFRAIVADGSLKRWMMGKEKIVKSISVSYQLRTYSEVSVNIISSGEIPKTAFLDTATATLYTSDKLYATDPDEQMDVIADEFSRVNLVFSHFLNKEQDPWFFETDWTDIYKLYAGISSTAAFSVVLKTQRIKPPYRKDLHDMLSEWELEMAHGSDNENVPMWGLHDDVQMEENERDEKVEADEDEDETRNQVALANGLINAETATAMELFKTTLRVKASYERAQAADYSEPMVYYKIGNEVLDYVHSFHNHSKTKPPKMHTIKATKEMQQLPTFVLNDDVLLPKRDSGTSEYSHRAFREFGERFAKVQFLVHPDSRRNEDLAIKYREFLRVGFTDPKTERNYEFLAASDSQWRDCTCVFFCVSGPNLRPISIASVHKWMGDFSDILIPSKRSTRMGMSFTPSLPTIIMEDYDWCEREDEKWQQYAMTDGCGEIPGALMANIAQMAGITDYVPSAVQIRHLGFKGMLTISTCEKVTYTSSMRKYKIPNPTTTQNTLEILNFTAPSKPASLNRQLILLLSSLGAPDSLFLNLVERQTIFKDYELLRKNKSSIKDIISELSPDTQCYEKVVEMANVIDKEPDMRNIMRAFADETLSLLHKANLVVPESRNLTGVTDVSKLLKPGEVFIRITENGKPRLITGFVLVSRSPALHPGDVQKFKAVRNRVLDGLDIKDCIVFSAQATARPDFHKLSGGDLDGDKYWVCYNTDFVACVATDAPAEYDSKPPVERDKSLGTTLTDIKESFLEYIITQSSVIGRICNAHMAAADLLGAKSPLAIQLAELHATAIDSVKNGSVVALPQAILDGSFKYPHYMGREGESYESTSICGKIFEAIRSKMQQLGIIKKPRELQERLAIIPHQPMQVPQSSDLVLPLQSSAIIENPAITTTAFQDLAMVPSSMLPPPMAPILPLRTIFPPNMPFQMHPITINNMIAQTPRHMLTTEQKKQAREDKKEYAIRCVYVAALMLEGCRVERVANRSHHLEITMPGGAKKRICVKATGQRDSHFSVHKREYDENCRDNDFIICVVYLDEQFLNPKYVEIHKLSQRMRSIKLDNNGNKWKEAAQKM
eukprot:Phypoly_transcript_00038.p1 GENE.Phypoly_transcript_00038~~Phypoly_transcript_00038.p1  ORF type:complete len:2405 (+),score=353.21 Phypoly_transcript_00038:1425-8639(+)